MNLYEMFSKKELGEPLQSEAERFATQGKSIDEAIFRAGWYVGQAMDGYSKEKQEDDFFQWRTV